MTFQPTLPQRERQPDETPPPEPATISTHAPTKGATISLSNSISSKLDFNPRSHKGSDMDSGCEYNVSRISTHAPTKGATLGMITAAKDLMRFQPTLPQRERLLSAHRFKSFKLISTHAPTKGATQIVPWAISTNIFQPTLPQRERQITYHSLLRP